MHHHGTSWNVKQHFLWALLIQQIEKEFGVLPQSTSTFSPSVFFDKEILFTEIRFRLSSFDKGAIGNRHE